MINDSFRYSFTTRRQPAEIYSFLLDPKNWWVGLYFENIEGESKQVNDEFLFNAGEGAHFSKQKLIETEKDRKIVWLVTESNLTFLLKTDEWTGTKICFDIEQTTDYTKIIFTHQGLEPQLLCYKGCASAWTSYLKNLELALK